ncbi:hypothetical protein F511_02880 [Dorcoceras hygrometricum]|uniref:RING-type E3 ubiquitin transferase n=1 Tax=Dorcoceras hygrometricum TaxID=472368 RepID=A0A2Z7AR90_9LAMI|nr:hypothetical protein F511_02880 [Dorcoceras hygrometricum]
MADYSKHRRPRNPNPEADLNSLRYRPTISSILLSNDPTIDASASKKKNNFSSSTFRGLGCTASSQVSVPAAIRTSANWEAKKVRRKVLKTKKSSGGSKIFCNDSSAVANISNNNANPLSQSSLSLALSSSCVSAPDVWCGPGIGLTTDAASVDCVVSRRPPSVSTRGKIDGVDRIILGQRERPPFSVRRMVVSEDMPFLEPDVAIEVPRFRADVSGYRHNRHFRNGFRDGLAEVVMLQSSLLTEGSPDVLDLHRDMRLDIDSMSYEELLELGDSIGYVNTGLREDEITHCLRSSKLAMLNNFTSHFPTEMERKCSICQEEYKKDDETGNLNCRHSFHIDCIKQWLMQKKTCPICKMAAVSQI